MRAGMKGVLTLDELRSGAASTWCRDGEPSPLNFGEATGPVWCTSSSGSSSGGGGEVSLSLATDCARSGCNEMAWQRWCLAAGEKRWPSLTGAVL
jgi:hypothetical protein